MTEHPIKKFVLGVKKTLAYILSPILLPLDNFTNKKEGYYMFTHGEPFVPIGSK